MSSSSVKPPQIFGLIEFDDRAQAEAEARGYLSHIFVKQADGKLYPVVFYDCVRLAQDLEYEVSTGRMCIADPGLIIVSAVTLSNIVTAIEKLNEEGFFSNFVPVSEPDHDSLQLIGTATRASDSSSRTERTP
jgi:hypothetical protein